MGFRDTLCVCGNSNRDDDLGGSGWGAALPGAQI